MCIPVDSVSVHSSFFFSGKKWGAFCNCKIQADWLQGYSDTDQFLRFVLVASSLFIKEKIVITWFAHELELWQNKVVDGQEALIFIDSFSWVYILMAETNNIWTLLYAQDYQSMLVYYINRHKGFASQFYTIITYTLCIIN